MTKVYIVKNKESGKILGVFKRKEHADIFYDKKCKEWLPFNAQEIFGIERHKVER